MGLVAGVIISGVLSAGASVYGANKQASATEAAQQANQASTASSNLSAWQNYLLSRGVNPSGVTATGQMPASTNTSTGAYNTKLPLWANVGSTFGQPKRYVKAGSTPVAATTPAAVPAATGLASTNWWSVPSNAQTVLR